jgi:hypothetical protein
MFRYTRWFWLAQGLTVASLGLLAAESWFCLERDSRPSKE